MLRLPLEVVVGERSTVNKDITQIVEVHEDADKFMRLLQLLGVWYVIRHSIRLSLFLISSSSSLLPHLVIPCNTLQYTVS